MHGHHGHAHHHHAHPPAAPGDKRYIIAIGLNVGFVALETVAGFLANSTALLSDAAHNLSDVLALALAGGAAWLARQSGGAQRTFGYSKATVLAALANGLVLVAACGAILWEAVSRLSAPEASAPLIVMAVAGAGVLINGATALLFLRGRKDDVNVRGAFLHMAADAAVSAAVIVAGLFIWLTGALWIDPAISIAVVALIAWSSWGLLKESLDLAMDAAPAHIDVSEVRAFLAGQPGVTAVHDLHVWSMSANEPSLTAHLVRPNCDESGGHDEFLADVTRSIAARFGISHVTLQIERAHHDCGGHD